MDDISNIVIKPLEKFLYGTPYTMHFSQNGAKKAWDIVKVHDSVVIVIYNKTRGVLVFVKQFRPAVYYGSISEEGRASGGEIDVKKYPPELGISIELCAGAIDKKLSVREIARQEILIECGYDVPLDYLQLIGSYRAAVGTSGSVQTAFYCEVTDDMKVSEGGGLDDETIDVIEMSVHDVEMYISQPHITSPPSFMFGVYWFFHNQMKQKLNRPS